MSREEAVKCLETGIEAAVSEINNGADIIGTGDMGIGNTTPSSAIVAAITGAAIAGVTGRGTGIDDKSLDVKITAIKRSLDINKPDKNDGLDVLAKVGGFEIGGIAGVILGCASMKIPVVIDGFISGAGALIAYTIEPKTRDYMIASHCSVEAGHKVILDYIGLKPLFNLDLRLGEGTGAALGINFAEASLKILNEMATFESAGVSEKGS
jgi:nicotinate-nucleotide--dimethylbenzimidazole phosphoribosyltransferase